MRIKKAIVISGKGGMGEWVRGVRIWERAKEDNWVMGGVCRGMEGRDIHRRGVIDEDRGGGGGEGGMKWGDTRMGMGGTSAIRAMADEAD